MLNIILSLYLDIFIEHRAGIKVGERLATKRFLGNLQSRYVSILLGFLLLCDQQIVPFSHIHHFCKYA